VTDARAWATALAAPIRARLGLPAAEFSASKRWARQQLQGLLSVHDRGDLLEQLPVYLDRGTRGEYVDYVAWHAALPPEAQSAGFYLIDQGVRLKRVFVHDHVGRSEETSPAAWDVARIVHYAQLGLAAEHLSAVEAWDVVARAARIATEAYDSWDAYARGFLYGRWFWQGYWEDGMKDSQRAVDALLAVGGAWRAIAWRTTADGLALAAEEPAAVEVRRTTRAVRAFVDCPACMVPILIREVSDAVVCEACGERSEIAARDAWGHAAAPPDEDKDEDEDDEDEDDAAEGLALHTNLDDRIQRFLARDVPAPVCAGCNAAIPLAVGTHRCACGRPSAVVAAPAWLRAIDPRLRFVVGGPLALGRPDDVLYLVVEVPA
jgi:hypothetical protein